VLAASVEVSGRDHSSSLGRLGSRPIASKPRSRPSCPHLAEAGSAGRKRRSARVMRMDTITASTIGRDDVPAEALL
jgi:hypothetical protein